MKLFNTRNLPLHRQYFFSIVSVLLIAIFCFGFSGFLGYRVIALVMLMTVSVIAMLFDMWPVLTAALMSAIIWNFFFIPPVLTFHIDNTEDLLMFLMYFLIAMLNAVLTIKIREAERNARDKEEKENSIKLYNTLLNSLSHELRTPISTIIGSVDTIIENRDRLSLENQFALLKEIENSGMRLNREVENLLNMSRLESGTLRPKLDWCDINDLINASIGKFSKKGSHTIRFVHDLNLPLFKVDEVFIEQIVNNLLDNAVRYTPTNSEILVEVTHDDNSCTIAISDSGPGIPQEESELIFKKFYRIQHSQKGGSGLGLSIVKGFVEAHQGKIEVQKNQAGGAKFIVRIPAQVSYMNSLKNE